MISLIFDIKFYFNFSWILLLIVDISIYNFS